MQLTDGTYEALWAKTEEIERCAAQGILGNSRASLVEVKALASELKKIITGGITAGQED